MNLPADTLAVLKFIKHLIHQILISFKLHKTHCASMVISQVCTYIHVFIRQGNDLRYSRCDFPGQHVRPQAFSL